MIQKDAIELIQMTAVRAAAAAIVRIPGDERRAYLSQNGGVTEVTLPPAAIRHTVDEFDDLIALAEQETGKRRQLWHNGEFIALLLDADDRRDRATMDLEPTGVWSWLESLGDGARYDQAQLLRLIRTKLSKAIAPDEAANLLASLRAVSFSRNETSSGEIDRARAALGRSIEEKCSGVDKLPESMIVTTKVFANVDDLPEVSITVLIDVDFETKSFVLIPLGDSVLEAAAEVQRAIGGRLVESAKGVEVYCGSPS